MVRRERTRPSPAHSGHGSGMTWPVPAQVGQTRLDTTWPRKPRWTLCTSPRPEQVRAGGRVRAGRGAGAGAGGAEDGGVDGDVLGDAEDRLVELELDRDQRVAAGAGAAARPAGGGAAEEGVHDVAEPAEAGAAEAAARAAAAGVERVAAEVDDAALLRVGQRLVGAGDLLEALLRARARG